MLLYGKEVSDFILYDLKHKIESLDKKLSLSVIEIGDNYSNKIYLKQKEKMCKKLGIDFNCIRFDEDILESDIITTVIL